MTKRVNVILPNETMQLVERVAPKGGRSRLIDQAIQFYIKQVGRQRLREQLREGAIKRSWRDLQIAEEWFVLENEAWPGK